MAEGPPFISSDVLLNPGVPLDHVPSYIASLASPGNPLRFRIAGPWEGTQVIAHGPDPRDLYTTGLPRRSPVTCWKLPCRYRPSRNVRRSSKSFETCLALCILAQSMHGPVRLPRSILHAESGTDRVSREQCAAWTSFALPAGSIQPQLQVSHNIRLISGKSRY